MSPVFAVLLGITFVLLIVVFVVMNRRKERERTETLRGFAETAGLAFEARSDVAAIRSRGALPLFERGHSKLVRNVMVGRLGDQEVAVFDYRYTIGSGKQSNTTDQTVVLVPGAKPSLPDLQMAPENPITRIAEKFGYQDIDLESSPEFSRRYVVRGADEAAIRAALYPRATSYFAAHEGWMVEVQSGTVGIYRGDSRPKPGDMRTFIEDALAAARSL
jgi:hypothetical protein